MKSFRPRKSNGKRVLLLEPNYQNKYPPVGLMKLATYHRIQGWEVVFFKGDLSRFVAERLTFALIAELGADYPGRNWGFCFETFCDYVWKGRDTGLSEMSREWGDALVDVLSRLKASRAKYRNGEYFKMHEWNRVLVTTLFTFYADITIETIKFAQRLEPEEIEVGGIMASVVPDYIQKETGIAPTTGVLAVNKIFDDKPISELIDNLPLDYSILEEIDYRFPAEDAFFGHTTRGCPNKCAFCAVPVLEPEYQSFRSLKDKLAYERKMFGERPNLLLMDNNVFASERFKDIIAEIEEAGFGKGEKITRSDELAICAARIREGYNPRAYVRKGCALLRDWLEHLRGESQSVVGEMLAKFGILRDWHGVSTETFLAAYEAVRETWERMRHPSVKSVIVDFNQGLDSRLALKDGTMEMLARLPVRPVRIAFDHWNLRKTYEDSIRAAAKAGFRQMSNYILYNFHDTPEELYWRLRLNVALCEELDVPIYSFPMKYHPIKDPTYFSNRDFLGEHWCRKYIRFVQLVLNSTMGKVGRGKTFFFKAFGESTANFREMLLMPEYMIRFRLDCEAAGVTARWKDALHKLNAEDEKQFRECLMYNEFQVRDESRESKAFRRLLAFYREPPSFDEISDAMRKHMVAEFDERMRDTSARLTEADIKRELDAAKAWPYSF